MLLLLLLTFKIVSTSKARILCPIEENNRKIFKLTAGGDCGCHQVFKIKY